MMTLPLSQILRFLDELAPSALAESWDNVGLLLGDASVEIRSVMTCLTLTPDVAAEALAANAGLIVSHHPILFRGVKQLTTATAEGRMILDLIRGGIAVFSPHTAFDSAGQGINQLLAERLELQNIVPLRDATAEPLAGLGAGRTGRLPRSCRLSEFLERIRQQLRIEHLQYVGHPDRTVSQVAIACGSAAEFLKDAAQHGCDLFLTGEARFHACFEAQQRDVALVLAGHYATERPGVEFLAECLQQAFPKLRVWASERECDPVIWSLGKQG
jgi:dinuclear metal center YbgI/SA1388 family protein